MRPIVKVKFPSFKITINLLKSFLTPMCSILYLPLVGEDPVGDLVEDNALPVVEDVVVVAVVEEVAVVAVVEDAVVLVVTEK